MSQDQAQVLSRGTNSAVVQLSGRAFPGIHLQGDTFAALLVQLADAARLLRLDPGNRAPLDELDDAVGELERFLGFYEATLSERGIRRPY
ncbi:DUF6959 family protein [Micromonospora chokoriensis]|uniref:Uncharacterized protein n=1 Tax=Micromonospora chokoriensis TaxID=356851 RepID=A0A1C4YB41_9ACTN|nr:hypothetical protein [Micromonospora chokoriensis]SCF17972.1 hypothetical protein GA0070612_4506 [Micromonospora chokoriensis]